MIDFVAVLALGPSFRQNQIPREDFGMIVSVNYEVDFFILDRCSLQLYHKDQNIKKNPFFFHRINTLLIKQKNIYIYINKTVRRTESRSIPIQNLKNSRR